MNAKRQMLRQTWDHVTFLAFAVCRHVKIAKLKLSIMIMYDGLREYLSATPSTSSTATILTNNIESKFNVMLIDQYF